MYCGKCKTDLKNCTCEDKEQRINLIVKSGSFIYQKCIKCNKHYALCKCKEPTWIASL